MPSFSNGLTKADDNDDDDDDESTCISWEMLK